MKKTIIAAIITGVCGIVAGGMGGIAVSNSSHTNNVNNNTLVFTDSSGEQKEITAKDYEKLQSNNDELQKDNEQLKEDLEESQQKLNESIAGNKEKMEAEQNNSKKILDLLYDGEDYYKYDSSESETLKIGGKDYSDAFSLSGGGSFGLFNLERDYNVFSFDIGRVDDSEIQNANLKIYLDNNLNGEYEIDAQTPYTPIEIQVAGATILKMEIVSDHYVKYGFVNLNLQ